MKKPFLIHFDKTRNGGGRIPCGVDWRSRYALESITDPDKVTCKKCLLYIRYNRL